jgi:hypothetical protein
MRARHIALAPFLQRLHDRIDALGAEQLREMIAAHAATLDPAARIEFLEVFDRDRRGDAEPGDDSLPADITDLVERLREGEYFDGWGWDDDLRDERAWGDGSWVDEMDDLFACAGQAFVAGELVLARDAYRGLFDALLLDEEVGTFSGPAAAPDMLGVDLVEAKARALRALYETTDPHGRGDALAARSPTGATSAIASVSGPSPRRSRASFPASTSSSTTGSPGCARLRRARYRSTTAPCWSRPQRGAVGRTASARWPASSAERIQRPSDRQTPELSALLTAHVRRLHATDGQRREWLAKARTTADARIAAIVEAKHRGGYDRAAQLAAACAEAVAITEGPPAAARAISELRDRYPRHVAFRAAVDAAAGRSPLLSTAPRRRR